MMGGLVMGVEVRGHDASAVTLAGSARRRLRLVAQVDAGGTDSEPSFGYVLHEGAGAKPPAGPLLPGPVILLKRGEPVAITIVNRLPEATAVHWHGIELESYPDGVPGWSGAGKEILPSVAPGDSIVVRSEVHADAVVLSVIDDGCGVEDIDPSQKRKAEKESFVQARVADARAGHVEMDQHVVLKRVAARYPVKRELLQEPSSDRRVAVLGIEDVPVAGGKLCHQ